MYERYIKIYHRGALMVINDLHKIKHATNDELYVMLKELDINSCETCKCTNNAS